MTAVDSGPCTMWMNSLWKAAPDSGIVQERRPPERHGTAAGRAGHVPEAVNEEGRGAMAAVESGKRASVSETGPSNGHA